MAVLININAKLIITKYTKSMVTDNLTKNGQIH